MQIFQDVEVHTLMLLSDNTSHVNVLVDFGLVVNEWRSISLPITKNNSRHLEKKKHVKMGQIYESKLPTIGNGEVEVEVI